MLLQLLQLLLLQWHLALGQANRRQRQQLGRRSSSKALQLHRSNDRLPPTTEAETAGHLLPAEEREKQQQNDSDGCPCCYCSACCCPLLLLSCMCFCCWRVT